MSDSDFAADHNLLFGILALQMDFISRDDLVKAMHAWVLEKSKPLGLVLVEQEKLTLQRLQLVDALVAEHLKVHANDPQQSLASVSSLDSLVQQQLQGIADAEVQASLSFVASAVSHDGEGTVDYSPPSEASSPIVTTPSTTEPRYRILRPHAKGGLGEVYVATDTELNREVALKEIREEHADDANSRGRFLLEAEVTGGLEHPGIVPVYGLGQYADGRPFYAMRFVRGDNLKEAINRFHRGEGVTQGPSERAVAFRGLLGRFVDVCNAVAYAHSRGILHRDLKPGNVMLGKYGETLLVDWGLAKPVDRQKSTSDSEEATLRPSSADSSVVATGMGSAIGTPAFMSPEQAAGRLDILGSASDIYSLGATLYAVLTGKAPFSGKDQDEVLRQVQQGEFMPPRQHNPEIPKSLEAICLKAMAVNADARYVTALALAEDIEHWLADEPVTAWREPVTVKMGRWLRNHKPFVAGVVAALAVGVLALATSSLLLKSANDKLYAANEQTEKEAARAKKAETKATTINEFLINDLLGQADPSKNPYQEKTTVVQLLDRAAKKIEANDTLKQQPQMEAAVRVTIGSTYSALGKAGLAVKHLRRAQNLYKNVLGETHRDSLNAMVLLSDALFNLNEPNEALALVRKVERLSAGVLPPNNEIVLKAQLVRAHILQFLGEFGESETIARKVYDITKADFAKHHEISFMARKALADILKEQYASLDKTRALYNENIQTHLKLTDSTDSERVAAAMVDLAMYVGGIGDLSAAEKLLQKVLTIQQKTLPPDHPSTLLTRYFLSQFQLRLGKYYLANKQARLAFEQALATLGDKHFVTNRARIGMADCLHLTAKFVPHSRNQLHEAEKLYYNNLKINEKNWNKKHVEYLTTSNNLAATLAEQNKFTKAKTILEEVWQTRRKLRGPRHPFTLGSLAIYCPLLFVTGEIAKAQQLSQQGLELARASPVQKHPAVGLCIQNYGVPLLLKRKFKEAEPYFREFFEFCQSSEYARVHFSSAAMFLRKSLAGQRKYTEYKRNLSGKKTYLIQFQMQNAYPSLFIKNFFGFEVAKVEGIHKDFCRLYFSPNSDAAYWIYAVPLQANDQNQKSTVTLVECKATKRHFAGKLTKDCRIDPLVEQSYQEARGVQMKANTLYRIEVAGKSFTPFVRLIDSAGKFLKPHDNSRPGKRAEWEFVPKEDGEYQVVVLSAEKQQTGDYTLIIQEFVPVGKPGILGAAQKQKVD